MFIEGMKYVGKISYRYQRKNILFWSWLVRRQNKVWRIAMRHAVLILFFFFIGSFASADSGNLAAHQDAVLRHSVSLVQLIAVPERYEKQKVWVTGFFVSSTNSLYLTKEDAVHSFHSNSIQISFDKDISVELKDTKRPNPSVSDLNFRYVGVEGIFSQKKVSFEDNVVNKVCRILEF